ncbi:sulfotransferase [uncultured Desulfobacter sp.]|uniref:sulfotransferase n=1 Tax=uncultured Desulfobacter sp. TaxID=240139 RepID=UPI0029C8779B|nr:sulfotransferase [uncultured Desulfobacter sp.]
MISNNIGRRFKRFLNSKIISSKKIFCISMQRTGTTSVGGFFKQFDYNTMGWPQCVKNNWHRLWYDGNYEAIFSSWDFKTGKVFEDSPWWHPEFYRVLFHRFPRSKFILFTRDPDKWFASMLSHSSGNVLGNPGRHCKIYRREWDYYSLFESDSVSSNNNNINKMQLAGKEQHYKELYNLHNKEVVDFFNKFSPDSLFTCNLEDQQKWIKLGKFIGIDVPADVEVHMNKSKR